MKELAKKAIKNKNKPEQSGFLKGEKMSLQKIDKIYCLQNIDIEYFKAVFLINEEEKELNIIATDSSGANLNYNTIKKLFIGEKAYPLLSKIDQIVVNYEGKTIGIIYNNSIYINNELKLKWILGALESIKEYFFKY